MGLEVDAKVELADCLERIESSNRIHLFEAGDERILFRIDGLIITVSEVMFDLLSTYRGLSVDERLARLHDSYGLEEVASALRSLKSIDAEGIFTEQVPELAPPDPESAEPGGILLMMTQTCNLACTYCYAGGGTYGSATKFLPADKAEAAIETMLARAPGRTSYTVTFFGGEPLLNFPLIRDVVAWCSRRGTELCKSFSFSITTNATIMTDEIVTFLKAHRFTVMVSYDGDAAQRDHRPFVGGRDSSFTVAANIRKMTEAGLPVQIRATLTRSMVNSAAVSDLVRIGGRLGARKITVSPVSTTKNSMFPAHEELTLGEDDYRQLRSLYQEASEHNLSGAGEDTGEPVRFDPHLHVVKALAKGQAVGMGRCGACFGMSAVSTEGTIYPCHRFVGMPGYEIGSLQDGISNEKVSTFFGKARAASWPKCSSCWVRLLCTGGCYYHNADGRGDFTAPDDAACDDYRETVKFSVLQLVRLRNLPAEQRSRYLINTDSV